MASMKAQLSSLKNVPLFSACSKKDLEKVAKAADEITMPAGSIVVDQGDMGREAYVILKGEVTIKRNNRKIATLGDGDVVGELSLLDHGPRTASVVCATDCTLLVIDQRRFINVLDEVPSIAHKLMGSLASRIRIMDRTYTG
jgi:CRP/FNR family cyclic AMP-dependent transcriptional regulator